MRVSIWLTHFSSYELSLYLRVSTSLSDTLCRLSLTLARHGNARKTLSNDRKSLTRLPYYLGHATHMYNFHTHTRTYMYSVRGHAAWFWYGVARLSSIDTITGRFCRISSLSWGSFAKETYNFSDPTDRSHPICRWGLEWKCVWESVCPPIVCVRECVPTHFLYFCVYEDAYDTYIFLYVCVIASIDVSMRAIYIPIPVS